MTFTITTFSIMTYNITTFSKMTLRIMAFPITVNKALHSAI
jgi:hypothetical protein